MYVSEDSFLHLREAKERDLLRDLERQRVQRERLGSQPSAGTRLKKWLHGAGAPALSAGALDAFLDQYPSVRIAVAHQNGAGIETEDLYAAGLDLILSDKNA